jgi:opacity protein-like surface antigen
MRRMARSLTRALLAAGLVAVTAGPARADWFVTPFLGVNFGGDASFGDVGDFEDNFEKKVVFGGTATWMSAGIIGAEVDFGWAPNFFEFTTGDADFDFGDSNLTTLMGNVVVGIPVGGQSGPGLRPYGTGGIGLIRSQIDGGALFDDLSANDLGFNVGGGVVGFINDNVGIRGDLRYFRSLQDTEPGDDLDLEISNFDFWRASVGVTFRFGGDR